MPKVSILVPTFNTAHFLPESLESALRQSYQDFEIIVIDDGSVDDTKKVVKEFMDKNPNKIRYFWQENQGLAIARNAAIVQSKGEYLALLDADDKWLPSRLEEGVKILDGDVSVGLVHANITRIDINGKELETPKRYPHLLNGFIFENIFLRASHIACPTVLFRRKCCDEVGMFDPKLTRLGCEDRDLWLRIVQKYKFAYIDNVLAYYRMSANSMSQNTKKMTEARLYVVDKYCPTNDKNKSKLRQKAISKIYRDLGDDALFMKDFINARLEYKKALACDPLAFWSWVNLIKAILKVQVEKSYAE